MTDLSSELTPRQLIPALVSPRELSHIVYHSLDHRAMIAWYNVVLGGHTVHADGYGGFMTFDEEHHRIAAAQPPQTQERADGIRVGLNHIAYTYGSLESWLSNYLRLQEQGIVPQRMIHHGFTLSFYYLDPDGNTVELLIDIDPDDKARTKAVIATEEFRANPKGYPLDADTFVEDYRRGVAIGELLRYPR